MSIHIAGIFITFYILSISCKVNVMEDVCLVGLRFMGHMGRDNV
jgi:hypothetical protein